MTAHGHSVAQPNTPVNYFHNSVKAVVDAYTGKVSLYEWDQSQHPDPLLKAWEGVYPGLVQPQSHISSALMAQLRYPTDLFNVQRYAAGQVPRGGAGELLQRERLLDGALRSDDGSGQGDELRLGQEQFDTAASVEVHVDGGRRIR